MPGGDDPVSVNRLAGKLGKGIFLTFVALFALACTQPQLDDSQPSATRIIVKFADAVHTAPGAFQVSPPGDAPLILRHERAMSGGAHVYNARMSEKQRAIIIRALNRRPDVDYAEADRRLM